MLQFAGGKAGDVNLADFLQLKRGLKNDGVIMLAS